MRLSKLGGEFVCEGVIDPIPEPVPSRYGFRDVILI